MSRLSIIRKLVDESSESAVTGVRAGDGTIAVHTDPARFDENYERVNSNLEYYGRTYQLGGGDDEEIWQIWRVLTQGGITKLRHASGSSVPDRIWDDRSTYFTSPVLINGASLLMDGTNEYVSFGNNFIFNNATAWTILGWFKLQNIATQQCLWSAVSWDINVYGYSLQINTSGKIFSQFRAPTTLRSYTGSTNTVSPGTWYMVAMTVSGSGDMDGNRYYLNDTVDITPASASIADWSGSVTDPCILGARGSSGGPAFASNGNFNQWFVFNKALSQSEITEAYNGGSPTDMTQHSAVANIVDGWGLNDDSNFPTEVDLFGSVNGTLTNMEVGDYDSGDVP